MRARYLFMLIVARKGLINTKKATFLSLSLIFVISLKVISYRYGNDNDIEQLTFLEQYEARCESMDYTWTYLSNISRHLLCPCLPSYAVSTVETKTTLSVNPYPMNFDEYVLRDGFWQPEKCVARQKIVLVIPYRNRKEHLKTFLKYIHTFLRKQLVAYWIFVIEQNEPVIFNRASLLNVGYLESQAERRADCYIFHDVDLLPEHPLNMYSCVYSPLHLGAYMDKHHYRLPYVTFFGGAVALTGAQFEAVNGMSNGYYGWGGEDDDFYSRIMLEKWNIHRYPVVLGRSKMIKHHEDKGNPPNPYRYDTMIKTTGNYARDGLTTVEYRVLEYSNKEQYTKIKVDLVPERNSECIADPRQPPEVAGNYLDCMKEHEFLLGKLDCCRTAQSLYCCDKHGFFERMSHWKIYIYVPFVIVFLFAIFCLIKPHLRISERMVEKLETDSKTQRN